MTKRTVVQESLIDDIDGSTAARTVAFAFEGTAYEIELSNKNYSTLEKALRPFVNAARRVPRSRAGIGGAPKAPKAQDTALIRAWAVENGMDVNSHGRIPTAIIEAYRAAQ